MTEQLVDQPTKKPTRKVAATGITAALTVIVIAIAAGFGYDMDVVLATAIVGVLAAGAGWLVKDRS